jgi:hypothetical protein
MYNIFIVLYIYIAIYVPSLVEIAPGVPELYWNIHPFVYLMICLASDSKIAWFPTGKYLYLFATKLLISYDDFGKLETLPNARLKM